MNLITAFLQGLAVSQHWLVMCDGYEVTVDFLYWLLVVFQDLRMPSKSQKNAVRIQKLRCYNMVCLVVIEAVERGRPNTWFPRLVRSGLTPVSGTWLLSCWI